MPYAKRKKSVKNSTPKSKPGLVTENWDRVFNKDGYQGVHVKVKNRRGSVIEFFLVDENGNVDGGSHKVDLDDGAVCWGDLPSTAQLVRNEDRARYGLLYLAPTWAKRSKVTVYDGPNSGKWPTYVSL